MPDYTHCLRPTFTENIVKTLLKGEPINIYGSKGQGRERLLEDLQNCQFENMQMLLINMKNYAGSYQGFVEDLGRKMGQTSSNKLEFLLNELPSTDKKTVLLLQNFDSLFNNPKVHQQYSVRFFDHLNSIKNRSNMALVCVTENLHSNSMIYINRGIKRGSWLDLKAKPLPPFDLDQIRAELKRHFPALYSDELDQISNKVFAHHLPYPLLRYFVDKLNNKEDMDIAAFAERLKKWQKCFDKERSFFSYANLNRFTQRIKNFFGALEVREIFNPIIKMLKVVLYDFPSAIVDIVKQFARRKK
jgi:hypothetical protein